MIDVNNSTRTLAVQILSAAIVLFISIDVFAGFGQQKIWVYCCFFFLVLLLKSWDSIHFAVLLLLTGLTPMLLPGVVKLLPSVPLLFPLVLSTVAVSTCPATRSTLSWLKSGKLDRVTCLLIVTVTIASSIALVSWALSTDNLGIGVEMIHRLKKLPLWLTYFFLIPLFAIINAFTEEAVFRGVVQEALARTMNRTLPVLILQASVFAAFHFLAGFPNGYLGYLMVLVYGIALGYLRIYTKGLLAPSITHVFGDLVIGYFLVIRLL